MNNQQNNNIIANLLSRVGTPQNPIQQNYINVIRSGDSRNGEQIADNLCKTYGVTREQAVQMAMKFFGLQ